MDHIGSRASERCAGSIEDDTSNTASSSRTEAPAPHSAAILRPQLPSSGSFDPRERLFAFPQRRTFG